MRSLRFLAVGLVSLLLTSATWAQAIVQGAGASFPSRVYKDWAGQYSRQYSSPVAYESVGSGKGVQRISARSVDFGASDVALSTADLAAKRLVQFPTVVGAVVPVVNLPGIGSNELRLDGGALASLMLGTLTRWDDPRLAALNPKLKLPNLPVVRIVRSDKSGTTKAFTEYLSLVSPEFQRRPGASDLPSWPGAPQSEDGNDAVVAALQKTSGALAYVSYDRVLKHSLSAVRLPSASDAWVAASESSMQQAVLATDRFKSGDETASLLNRTGASWPITVATFILVDAEPPTAERASRTLQFLYWVYLRGDRLVDGTGFVALPVSVQAKLAARFLDVKPQDRRPLNYVVR